MTEIRPMTERDIDAVAAMEQACFSDPWPREILAAELTNPISLWLVAVADGCVCGYVGSQTCGEQSDMMNLAVAESARRQGIGARLVSELTARLFRQGCRELTLEVRESNAAALALYRRLGFEQVGRRPDYYYHPREAALILRKELSGNEDPCH